MILYILNIYLNYITIKCHQKQNEKMVLLEKEKGEH